MRLTELLDPEKTWSEADLPVGDQEPTHFLPAFPAAEFTHGHDAVEFAEYCGYELFDFQKQGLVDKLGCRMVMRRDGSWVERWAAQETCDVVARRNGKSVEIEVLILFALFVLGEKKIMYTAHRDDTAEAVFNNVVAAIQRTPKLWAELDEKGPRLTNGQRRIKLRNGAVCHFRTRTTDAARGQGYDRLILDEAQALTSEEMSALMPLVSGNEHAQLNYAASPGSLKSTVLAKVWRSYEKGERGLCYRGWHADPDADFDDLALIARVNPRLGRGLSYEFIAKEFARMTRVEFGRERCGAATYPREEGIEWVIPEEAWKRTVDGLSEIVEGAVTRIVLEADRDLARGTIGAAGRRADGLMHLEPLAHEPGVSWMVERVVAIREAAGEENIEVWVDPKSPCGFMLGDLREAGVPVHEFGPSDFTDASGWFVNAANPKRDLKDPKAPPPPPTIRQRGSTIMLQALAAAETRKVGERDRFQRSVPGEVSQGPLLAPMMAAWAVVRQERKAPPPPPPVSRSLADRDPAARSRPRRRRPGFDIATTDF